MRRLVVAAAVAAAVTGSLGAGTASAYCDPDYRPACLNDCQVPDLRDPLSEYHPLACPK